jgi:hypothetical protein
MCERFYPDYVFFYEHFSFGDVRVTREAIDFIRCSIIDQTISAEEATSHYHSLNLCTPDTDDFTTVYISNALDACNTIFNSLQFMLDSDFSHIEYVSRYGTDRVDRDLLATIESDTISDEMEKSVRNHPLMAKEKSIQNEVISYLVSVSNVRQSDIEYLINVANRF